MVSVGQEHFLGVCELVHLPSGIGNLSELLVSKHPAPKVGRFWGGSNCHTRSQSLSRAFFFGEMKFERVEIKHEPFAISRPLEIWKQFGKSIWNASTFQSEYIFFTAHSAASIYEIISVRCFSAPTVSCIVMEVMPLPSARRAMRWLQPLGWAGFQPMVWLTKSIQTAQHWHS